MRNLVRSLGARLSEDHARTASHHKGEQHGRISTTLGRVRSGHEAQQARKKNNRCEHARKKNKCAGWEYRTGLSIEG
jgi:hypothetical protein